MPCGEKDKKCCQPANACSAAGGPHSASQEQADKAVEEMKNCMGGYVPCALDHIRQYYPDLAVTIKEMDKVLMEDGALDRKTKRLIALACVAVRMCEDCVYPQARVAANYGATSEEILEAMHVAVVVGGVPSWSMAKKGLTQILEELKAEKEQSSE
ncbi:carboxymuconolactone decarboxylase family protein [Candidatus Methanomassiliicoccus intestinalis]|uniref:carboxymuconolactone decarboxylase family protein n=1 Tax=Candidatus Methanomassiliicoccus intestinalis TaxID=1406512 RepID=UPI0037DC168D